MAVFVDANTGLEMNYYDASVVSVDSLVSRLAGSSEVANIRNYPGCGETVAPSEWCFHPLSYIRVSVRVTRNDMASLWPGGAPACSEICRSTHRNRLTRHSDLEELHVLYQGLGTVFAELNNLDFVCDAVQTHDSSSDPYTSCLLLVSLPTDTTVAAHVLDPTPTWNVLVNEPSLLLDNPRPPSVEPCSLVTGIFSPGHDNPHYYFSATSSVGDTSPFSHSFTPSVLDTQSLYSCIAMVDVEDDDLELPWMGLSRLDSIHIVIHLAKPRPGQTH